MKNKFLLNNGITNFLLFATSIFLLIYPAIMNGYPLVYSDSGTYIASGFNLTVPVDRPIMYSFFVRHISLYETLWLVIITQAIIITSLILILFRFLVNTRLYFFYTFVTILVLSLCTGVSNYCSQIMPDIFSAVAIISFALLLILPSLNNYIKVWLSLLLVFSNMCHSSNLLITTIIILLVLVFYRFFRKKLQIKFNQIFFIVALTGFSWLIIPTMNYTLGAGFKVSRAPNIFVMGRLIQSGILNDYLKTKCKTETSSLCKYIDRLPSTSPNFLWDHSSPLYDGNCFEEHHIEDCWLTKNDDYKPVIHEIFTTPEYVKRYFVFAFYETLKQLVDFQTGPLIPMMEGSPVIGNIQSKFKKDYPSYISSHQSKRNFTAEKTNLVQPFIVIISLIFCIAFLLIKITPINFKCIIIVLFSGILFNAIVCSTFSMVVGRFQGRVIWLLPLLFLLISFNYLKEYFNKKNFPV